MEYSEYTPHTYATREILTSTAMNRIESELGTSSKVLVDVNNNFVREADSDNKTYGRKNAGWVELDTTSIEWGNISGNITDQEDLQEKFDGVDDSISELTESLDDKQDTLTAGPNITITTSSVIDAVHPVGSCPNKESGLYKFSTDSYSHVGSVNAVTKSDIANLGIPSFDCYNGIIIDGSDLNNYKTIGTYVVSNSASTSLITNIPVEKMGKLLVESGSGFEIDLTSAGQSIVQTYKDVEGDIYVRYITNPEDASTWTYSTWIKVKTYDGTIQSGSGEGYFSCTTRLTKAFTISNMGIRPKVVSVKLYYNHAAPKEIAAINSKGEIDGAYISCMSPTVTCGALILTVYTSADALDIGFSAHTEETNQYQWSWQAL